MKFDERRHLHGLKFFIFVSNINIRTDYYILGLYI